MYAILSTELNVAGDKVGGVQLVLLQRLCMRVLSADIAGCWSGQDKVEPSSTELTGTAAIFFTLNYSYWSALFHTV
jgi:hypothetical protein